MKKVIIGFLFLVVAVALLALGVVLQAVCYNVAAEPWHLPPLTWLQIVCTNVTLAGFAGAIGAGARGRVKS